MLHKFKLLSDPIQVTNYSIIEQGSKTFIRGLSYHSQGQPILPARNATFDGRSKEHFFLGITLLCSDRNTLSALICEILNNALAIRMECLGLNR